MPTSIIIIISLFLLALIILAANIRVVQQSRASVIERLGAFQSVWSVGLHVKIPFIDRVAKTVSLKEQVVDFAPQPVITKDNVTMQIDTVVYYQITDPKLYILCYNGCFPDPVHQEQQTPVHFAFRFGVLLFLF